MENERVRAHIMMPRELVAEVDELVGERRRSQFVVEAVRERLARARRDKVLKETAGILKDADYPHWATPEKTSAWVRAQRRLDDESLQRKLAGPDQP